MTLVLAGALGVLITLGVGALVRAHVPGTRPGPLLGPPLSLTAWFHCLGLLVSVAVLAPPSGPDLFVDLCVRVGTVLLVEGILVVAGVVVLAGRLNRPAPDDVAVRPTWEERP